MSSLTITPLAAEDDGSKFACKHDDGEDTKSLQTYRLKLKLPETTAAAVAPTATAPTTPASEEAAVTKLAPVNEKDARSDEVEEKDDGDGITNEIGKEEKIGGNGNGALNASLSSALGAILAIVFAARKRSAKPARNSWRKLADWRLFKSVVNCAPTEF